MQQQNLNMIGSICFWVQLGIKATAKFQPQKIQFSEFVNQVLKLLTCLGTTDDASHNKL